MVKLCLIVVKDKNNGIGKRNTIPWNLPTDLKQFKKITTETQDPEKRNAVIMGRKTWLSIPSHVKPLSNRLNVILSRKDKLKLPEECLLFHNIGSAVATLEKDNSIENIFFIGGSTIYKQSIAHCEVLYITQLKEGFSHDVIFPEIPNTFKLIDESPFYTENNVTFQFQKWVKQN